MAAAVETDMGSFLKKASAIRTTCYQESKQHEEQPHASPTKWALAASQHCCHGSARIQPNCRLKSRRCEQQPRLCLDLPNFTLAEDCMAQAKMSAGQMPAPVAWQQASSCQRWGVTVKARAMLGLTEDWLVQGSKDTPGASMAVAIRA